MSELGDLLRRLPGRDPEDEVEAVSFDVDMWESELDDGSTEFHCHVAGECFMTATQRYRNARDWSCIAHYDGAQAFPMVNMSTDEMRAHLEELAREAGTRLILQERGIPPIPWRPFSA